MSQLLTQSSSIQFGIAIVRVSILMKQDADDTDWEISYEESDVLLESTLASDIEEDDLDDQQEVLYLGKARLDEIL
jgi:hypothetical protein